MHRMDFPHGWHVWVFECECAKETCLGNSNILSYGLNIAQMRFHSDRLKGKEKTGNLKVDAVVVHELCHVLLAPMKEIGQTAIRDYIPHIDGLRSHVWERFDAADEQLVRDLEPAVLGIWRAGIAEGKRRAGVKRCTPKPTPS